MVSIICVRSRAAGKQYTLRLLPDFLIPDCVIRLDRVVEAVAEDPSGMDIEKACRVLGCVDERTARSHLKRLKEAMDTIALKLAERRAKTPELGELPETAPDEDSLMRLEALYRNETEAVRRAGGDVPLLSLGHILQAALWKPGSKKPSTFAFVGPRPP